MEQTEDRCVVFRIAFREATVAERNARKKEGSKDRKKKQGQRENANLHDITRLCRLIFKGFGSNRKLDDWNGVRRHLTTDKFWRAVGRGGHCGGDLGLQFKECVPGTFLRHRQALEVRV